MKQEESKEESLHSKPPTERIKEILAETDGVLSFDIHKGDDVIESYILKVINGEESTMAAASTHVQNIFLSKLGIVARKPTEVELLTMRKMQEEKPEEADEDNQGNEIWTP